MNKFLSLTLLLTFLSNFVNATGLAKEANESGINPTCTSYLSQIEKYYDLDVGLNITYAHPEDPQLKTSLHIATKNYNNGSSIFSATLSPKGDYCDISTVLIRVLNNENCEQIILQEKEIDSTSNINFSSDNAFTVISPLDNSHQKILTKIGEIGCTITETRMMWPGR